MTNSYNVMFLTHFLYKNEYKSDNLSLIYKYSKLKIYFSVKGYDVTLNIYIYN